MLCHFADCSAPDSDHSAAEDDKVLHIEAADPSNQITKSELRTLLERMAHGLRHKFKIGSNGPNKDTVTVISHGQILAPAVLYAIIAAGGVYSAASPSSTVSDLARQIKIGKSNLIICGRDHIKVASDAAKECGLPLSNVLCLDSTKGAWKLESLQGNVNALSRQKLKWRKIFDPKLLKESLIVILWSSGTTGLPKGVMLSHTNLVAETFITALAGREWAAKQIEAGTFTSKELTTLAHLPISHIAGLFGYLIAPIYSGGTVYWMAKYEWQTMLKHLKEIKPSSFYTVPSIWLRISKSPEITDHLQNVEGASTGAAPMDGNLQRAANTRVGDGKSQYIGQTWGLSESTGAVTAMPKGETDDTGSISPILPGVELRMVDDNFQDVEPGQEGELIIRSALITQGYYDNPEATRDAFLGDWFLTGDMAVMRNGKFYIVDRKKASDERKISLVPPETRQKSADLCMIDCRSCSSTKVFRLRRPR